MQNLIFFPKTTIFTSLFIPLFDRALEKWMKTNMNIETFVKAIIYTYKNISLFLIFEAKLLTPIALPHVTDFIKHLHFLHVIIRSADHFLARNKSMLKHSSDISYWPKNLKFSLVVSAVQSLNSNWKCQVKIFYLTPKGINIFLEA